jgi:hypothetical protein
MIDMFFYDGIIFFQPALLKTSFISASGDTGFCPVINSPSCSAYEVGSKGESISNRKHYTIRQMICIIYIFTYRCLVTLPFAYFRSAVWQQILCGYQHNEAIINIPLPEHRPGKYLCHFLYLTE